MRTDRRAGLVAALGGVTAILVLLGVVTTQYFLWNENQGCRSFMRDPDIGRLVNERAPVEEPTFIPIGVSCEWTTAFGPVTASQMFPVPNLLFAAALVSLGCVVALALIHRTRKAGVSD